MSLNVGEKFCNFCHGNLGHRGGQEVCTSCGTPYQEKPPYAEPLPKCPACGSKIQFKGGIKRCINDACAMPYKPAQPVVVTHSTAPLDNGVEVNRGPDDTQRVPHSDGNQKRHSKR